MQPAGEAPAADRLRGSRCRGALVPANSRKRISGGAQRRPLHSALLRPRASRVRCHELVAARAPCP
jgi:hypothetical protein